MKLEKAVAADLTAVVALINAAFRGTGPKASWNTEAVYIDGNRTTEALLAGEIAAKPEAVLLLSRSEPAQDLIGTVWLEPAGRPGVWYLGSLTIDPGLQNAGVGRRLLAAAEAWALGRGAHTIRMKVVHVRDTLIAWYLRRGYHLTGEVEPFPYHDQRFGIPKRDDLTFVVLEKKIDPTDLSGNAL